VVEAAGVEGEESFSLGHPMREVSKVCAVGDAVDCPNVADPCNGPLQEVAPADPVAKALEQARAAWLVGHDGRRLRRDLLRLLAELED
jgi:hypothetical protein